MISIEQATKDSAVLSQLTARTRESSARLDSISDLLPEQIRPYVKAGPIAGDTWYLLVSNSAATAKLRQLSPRILAQLRSQGHRVEVLAIRTLAMPSQDGSS